MLLYHKIIFKIVKQNFLYYKVTVSLEIYI